MAVESADDLYGLPLERFVPERTALARALRADGRREEAARVAAMRKPSVAAWAVNQLIRTQGEAIAELFGAGDDAKRAQAELIAGRGDGEALREGAHRERAAVEALVDSARGLLTSDGHELSSSMLERVADTLHAAALDDDARPQVSEGRLERELRHVGLVGGMGADPASRGRATSEAPRGRAQKSGKAPSKRAKRETGAEERAAAERAERERVEAHRAARSAEAEARRRSERAERAVDVAEERRGRAAQALEEAQEALAEARVEAESAEEAHRCAKSKLEAT